VRLDREATSVYDAASLHREDDSSRCCKSPELQTGDVAQ